MEEGNPACWEVQRDEFAQDRISASDFFDDTLAGRSCAMNWFMGIPTDVGLFDDRGYHPYADQPPFTEAAPALLGHDNDIGEWCEDRVPNGYEEHAWLDQGICVPAVR